MVGSEMVQILESVLPAHFGGSALDYQLMEQENEQGLTRLFLLISPHLEIADERQVIDVLLGALQKSSSQANAAQSVWKQAGIFQIKRQNPIWTARGKLMPLYKANSKSEIGSGH